jgi:hypothetical protein
LFVLDNDGVLPADPVMIEKNFTVGSASNTDSGVLERKRFIAYDARITGMEKCHGSLGR